MKKNDEHRAFPDSCNMDPEMLFIELTDLSYRLYSAAALLDIVHGAVEGTL